MDSFDQAPSRLGSSCIKWDRYVSRFQMEDVIPLWVADMDFACLPEVQEAIIQRAKHPIYGYTDPSHEVIDAIISWETSHHGIDVKPEEIVLNTGVVYGFYTLIDLLVKQDEKVLVQPPIYPPFFNTPKSLQRGVVYNPLKQENGLWVMDVQGMEALFQNDPSIRLFLMCNPHNPTGHCYTLEEINIVMELCNRYHVWVISDEIHADIIMPNQHHTSALRCDPAYWNRLILLGSPTKTFNLAGLKISYAIVKQPELQTTFAATAKANGLSSINIFGMEALIAAYEHGDLWRKECCDYIYENFCFLQQFLQTHLPQAKFAIPEATYLAWVDFSAYHVPEDFAQRLKFEAKVELQAGSGFGETYGSYQRINVACPRSTLEEGLKRIVTWLEVNHYLK